MIKNRTQNPKKHFQTGFSGTVKYPKKKYGWIRVNYGCSTGKVKLGYGEIPDVFPINYGLVWVNYGCSTGKVWVWIPKMKNPNISPSIL